MNKRILAVLTALLMAFTALPLSLAEGAVAPAAEKAFAPTDYWWTVPEGYDEYSYNKIAVFLETEDSNSLSNGLRINTDYEVTDPTTWYLNGKGVTWTEDENGVLIPDELLFNRAGVVGELDLSGCRGINRLDIGGNYSITGVDISDSEAKNCSVRQCGHLTSLDFSGCEELLSLDCSYCDQLAELNWEGCTSPLTLVCSSCPLITSLDISTLPNIVELTCLNCNALTEVNIHNNYSLKKFVSMGSVGITSLDFSSCPAIEYIQCDGENSALSELILGNNPLLTDIICNRCSLLTELDLSSCVSLETIYCGDCSIESLDFSNCPNIVTISAVRNTGLSELIFNNNPKLKSLNCSNCPLVDELDLTAFPNLESAYLDNCNLSELDFGNCPKLRLCYISGNAALAELDFSNNPALSSLGCNNCPLLTSLDFSACPALSHLQCANCAIGELDVADCPELFFLNVNNNALTEIDVTNNPLLRTFRCTGNPLVELNVSQNPLVPLDRIYANGSGTVGYSVDQYYSSDTALYVYAVPSDGAEFLGWFNEYGELVSAEAECSFEDGIGDFYELQAYFTGGEDPHFPYDYNENDYLKAAKLLAHRDVDNVSNGAKLSAGYVPNDPATWYDAETQNGLIWTEINGVKYLSSVNIPSGLGLTGELDLSNCAYLNTVSFEGNDITAANFANTPVRSISCSDNPHMLTIELEGCSELTSLVADDCYLLILDLYDCAALTELSADNNLLFILDISHNPALQTLSCLGNRMDELDMSANAALSSVMLNAEGRGYLGFINEGVPTAIAYAGEGEEFYGWYNAADELVSSSAELNCSALSGETLTAKFSRGRAWTVPAGYDEHDYNMIVSFLETKDKEGVKNGEKLRGDVPYDPNVPESFSLDGNVVQWTDEFSSDGTKQLIRFFSVAYQETLGKVEGSLVGVLDLSGCVNLWTVTLDMTCISKVDVSDVPGTGDWGSGLTIGESGANYYCLQQIVAENSGMGLISCISTDELTRLDLTNAGIQMLLITETGHLDELDLSTCDTLGFLLTTNELKHISISENSVIPVKEVTAEGNGKVGFNNYIDFETYEFAHKLTAEPDEGEEFVGWYNAKSGRFLSDDPEYDYTTGSKAAGDVTDYVAVFTTGGQLIKGDLNGDGVVSFLDVATLYGYVCGVGELSMTGRLNADLNGDGAYSFADVSELYQYIIGVN